MVRKCEEEMDRCLEAVKKRERLAMTGMRRGRGSPNKYWEEMIRQDKGHDPR
uniref:Uncharacterized protein n=1 Tax=Solanum tuberosum TaxID=4113 RepID=M1C880_SOLTU